MNGVMDRRGAGDLICGQVYPTHRGRAETEGHASVTYSKKLVAE